MSIALQNQVDELEAKVIKLTQQMQELTKLLKPITADTIQHKRRGRPPNQSGHMQPND